MNPPAPEEIQKIVAMPDRVQRNLEITRAYHRLSTAMAIRTGACLNWCSYATWASAQAGRTIRGEDWIDVLQHNTLTGPVLAHPVRTIWRWFLRLGLLQPDKALGRLVRKIHTPFDALERASDAVMRGNLKVFEEIGWQFSLYLHTGKPDLRPGPPPDGQDLLHSAFDCYDRQRNEPDPVPRSQSVFLANIRIGLHEQTRLQPQIQEALEALPDTFPRTFDRPARVLVRKLITRSLMTLALPVTTLELGRHIDRPPAPTLAEIRAAELQELMARFEPCAGKSDDCGASDWANLDQRMHYILHVFRCFHENLELLESP